MKQTQGDVILYIQYFIKTHIENIPQLYDHLLYPQQTLQNYKQYRTQHYISTGRTIDNNIQHLHN